MNGYERYINMVKGNPVDIVPRIPILMAFAANYIGSDYGSFASDYRILTEANIKCAEAFGFDQVSAISDPYRETAGFGSKIRFVKDGVPRCESTPLQKSKNLSRLEAPDPYHSPRMLDRIMAIREYRRRISGKFSILGWVEGPAAEAADLRGVTDFLFDMMDDEEFTLELMDLCTDAGIKFALAQLSEGADTIGIGDAIVSQLSPATYERLILPYQRKLIDAIHKAGGLARLHICGNITNHLTLIKKLNVDILDIDWLVDIGMARKILGNEIVLVGNLNPVEDIKNGSPDEIKERCRKIYNSIGNKFMVGAGCEIPAGTCIDNLVALCSPIAVIRV